MVWFLDGLNYNFITGPSIVNPSDRSVTAIDRKPEINVVKGFGLVRNYPNPFNPSTTIQFSLEKAAPVTLQIYNILGEKVKTLLDKQTLSAGEKYVDWNGTVENGSPAASGVYFYKVSSGSNSVVKKMILVK